jgi:hypothetical protein
LIAQSLKSQLKSKNLKSDLVIASPYAKLRVHPEGFFLKVKLRVAIPILILKP